MTKTHVDRFILRSWFVRKVSLPVQFLLQLRSPSVTPDLHQQIICLPNIDLRGITVRRLVSVKSKSDLVYLPPGIDHLDQCLGH